LTSKPTNFNLFAKTEKLIEARKKMIEDDKIDWGLGELLSYASILHEGSSVRISGQDCKRGTFTHRHAVYVDTNTGAEFIPLTHINAQAEFCIYNSALSEAAVLGFEYGNSIADPTYLTI